MWSSYLPEDSHVVGCNMCMVIVYINTFTSNKFVRNLMFFLTVHHDVKMVDLMYNLNGIRVFWLFPLAPEFPFKF